MSMSSSIPPRLFLQHNSSQTFPQLRREFDGLVVIELLPHAAPKHRKAPAALPQPRRADLRPRYQVVVDVTDDLGGGGPVVLHDVPVGDARGADEGAGKQAQVGAQIGRLPGRHVG